MTAAPRRDPLAFDSPEDVTAAIRAAGGRVSAARRAVLTALFAADGPVSAEYLAAGLGGRLAPLDTSSVYRNLERLEELGVVRHVHLGHGPGLYALDDGREREYLVCERCDRVDAVDATHLDPVRAAIRAGCGYEARFGHFPIVGLCRHCSRDPARTSPAPPDVEETHSHGHHVHAHARARSHPLSAA